MEKREVERPFISREAVRQALNAMLYASKPDRNPLYHLTLVSHILNTPSFPAIENPRVFATRQLLIEYITQEMRNQRQNFGLPHPAPSETRLDAQAAIAADAQTEIPEFIGWSVLYYRYVRVDLNISAREYSSLSFIDERTLRRYQENAVTRLTDVIALREWETRQHQRELYLRAQIPGGASGRLFGRVDLLSRLHSAINSNESARILITGPHGIGKTSIAKALIEKQVTEKKIDSLVWLVNPHSARYVLQSIYEQVVHDPRISLKEYTLLYRLAVVIDDLHLFDDEQIALLVDMLKDLSNVCVIIVNASYVALGSNFEHVVVPEIDRQWTVDILRASGRSHWQSDEDLHIYAEELWDRVGGNPMAIGWIAGTLVNMPATKPLVAGEGQLVARIFASGYASLDDNTRCVLFMCVLMAPDEFSIEHIQLLWPMYETKNEHILALLSGGFITQGSRSDFYRLYDAAGQFVKNLYRSDPDTRRIIHELLEHLNYAQAEIGVALIQNILRQSWITLDSRLHDQWTHFIANHERANYADRVAAFESIDNLTPEMKIAYAVGLRRTGDIDNAEGVLLDLITLAGDSGDFLLQGRGLLELSILHHYRGEYKEAIQHLDRVKRVGNAYNDSFLTYRCWIEHAQIAIEMGELQIVREMIDVIPFEQLEPASRLALALVQGEFYLQERDIDRALYFARLGIDFANEKNRGRAYTLMGRIEVERHKWEDALNWLDAGVTCLEQEGDLFALARAKSNLAAVMLLRRSNFEIVRQLLNEAIQLQRHIKDRVGTVFTLHNIRVLDRMYLD